MFSFNIHNHKFSHIHFIGIGGISMSGLAEILITEGYKVSGSDMSSSRVLNRLESKGVRIYMGHDKENITDSDLVVYTDAISKDNPEYLEAIGRNITVVDRGTFLGALMKGYKNSIAVSGTHGKTTTTGMISVILNNSHLEPTILLGGELDQIGGNVKIGKDSYLLTEACEYKGNILKFHPTIGVILNIEEDHLDYFKNIDHIVNTFTEFVQSIPSNGHLIVNNDDKHIPQVISNLNCNIVSFGIENKGNYYASDITFTEDGFPEFKLTVNDSDVYDARLGVIGIHNVYNALAAIATTHSCGIPIEYILDSITDYRGTRRRQETKGFFNGVKVIDDYAHHPTEIKATLNALKKIRSKTTWCIFQPHTYTRTTSLLTDFSEAFYEVDKVLVSDIYAAREKDTGLIHSKDLVNALKEKGVDAMYFSSFDDITDYLKAHISSGDIVVTMGAGDIYKVGEMLLEE